MKRFIAILFIYIMAVMPLKAQYVDEISEFTQQGVGFDMSNARSSAAFLDWSKIQMNHSVSMSMGSSAFGSRSTDSAPRGSNYPRHRAHARADTKVLARR